MGGEIMKSKNKAQETIRIHKLLYIVNPDSWNNDKVVSWKAAEKNEMISLNISP